MQSPTMSHIIACARQRQKGKLSPEENPIEKYPVSTLADTELMSIIQASMQQNPEIALDMNFINETYRSKVVQILTIFQ